MKTLKLLNPIKPLLEQEVEEASIPKRPLPYQKKTSENLNTGSNPLPNVG